MPGLKHVHPSPLGMKPNFRPIIDCPSLLSSSSSGNPATGVFDPARHLSFSEAPQTLSMEDLGYSKDAGVSPVAVSQPFPLFSAEAIQEMRHEIFRPEIMERCKFESDIAACQLRGFAQKYAPFVYDAWRHSETLAIISKIAGVDLIPQFDYEIGHVNLSVKSEEQTKNELAAVTKERILAAADEGISGCPWEDDKPVVGWHRDSYPFVCVLMLSDCTGMVGGETAIRTGTGEIIKVRGPQMGCAVVLQGRYITHQALRALGAQERITMVTSFRPRSPFLKDDTVLTTVRPVSDLSELYYDFTEYRLEILEERLRNQIRQLRDRRRAGKKVCTRELKSFLTEQQQFLVHTNEEIVTEDDVQFGLIPEIGADMPVAASQPASTEGRLRKRPRRL